MREHQAELQGKNEELKDRLRDSEKAVKALTADCKACSKLLDHTRASFKARDADAVALQEKADALTSRLVEAERSASEARAELAKTLTNLEKTKAESEAQYNRGFDDAGDSYEEQVKGITEQVWREGWRAALRAQGLDKASTLWTAVPLRSDADLGSDAEADDEEANPVTTEVPSDANADISPEHAEANVSGAEAAEAVVAESADAATAEAAEAAVADAVEAMVYEAAEVPDLEDAEAPAV